MECDRVNFDTGKIEPISISLNLDRGLELLVREPGVAGLLATIHLLSLLALVRGLGSSLADVSEELVEFFLAEL